MCAFSSFFFSVEFDKEFEFLAVAGITKHVKIYDFSMVVNNRTSSLSLGEGHYAVKDLTCPNKISCIAWNAYYRNFLLSSDYDGRILLWDVHAGTTLRDLQAHDKRVWAVDFNKADANLFVSGSDDCMTARTPYCPFPFSFS